jgi:hypothetical protein
MICRLWGSTETMRCPFGCRPSRELTEAEGYALLERSRQVGGTEDAPAIDAYLAELARDPALQPVLRRYMQGDASVEPQLIEALRRVTGAGPGAPTRKAKGKKRRR